jgi:hypothetical protein
VPYDSGAEHQRQLYRQTGNWKAVIDDLSHRLSQELDKSAPAPAAAAIPRSDPSKGKPLAPQPGPAATLSSPPGTGQSS